MYVSPHEHVYVLTPSFVHVGSLESVVLIIVPFSNLTVNNTRDDYTVSINQDKNISVKIIGDEVGISVSNSFVKKEDKNQKKIVKRNKKYK